MNAGIPPGAWKVRGALHRVVGTAALLAPALHTLSDFVEWNHRGFTDAQLWLNLVAFVPMPVLLLGLCAVQVPRPGVAGYLGALLYGVAFAYFTWTTIHALAGRVPNYEALWETLGATYTFFGALMIVGGALFAGSALRIGWYPRFAVMLFLAGLVVNLALALLQAPDILQTVGSAVRNLGLMAMGRAVLLRRPAPAA